MISNSWHTSRVMKPAAWLIVVVMSACSLTRQPADLTTPAPTAGELHLLPPSVPVDTPTASPTEAQITQPVDTPTLPVESSSTPIPLGVGQMSGVTEFPEPQDYSWQLITLGLSQPIGLANAGDGSGRLFVIEQGGRIRIIQDNILLPESFLDIRDRTEVGSSEQGLLGLAFHPRYAQNGYFFVNYTDLNGDTVIARFRVAGQDPNQADASSEERLLFIEQPYGNHNGGGMAFGPNGYLYLGLGDGGSAGDPAGNAQSLTTYLGKILRLDVDSEPGYTIPADNPFLGSGALPEIWAYGLRNPWRFSFDRLTGDLFIGDVGQNTWEEINYLAANSTSGVNFGWDYREGLHPFEGKIPAGMVLTDPVAEYDHSQGCSVTGGVVYRGQVLSAWQGVYIFGDYCTGFVWGLIQNPDHSWVQQLLFETGANITAFGDDESGEVYLVDYTGGVYQLFPTEP